MKFEIINDGSNLLSLKDVLAGTLVEYQGQVCLRTLTGLVSLSDPDNTWYVTTDKFVSILPMGAKVTLTQE